MCADYAGEQGGGDLICGKCLECIASDDGESGKQHRFFILQYALYMLKIR